MSVNTSKWVRKWVNSDLLTDDGAVIIDGGFKLTETSMPTTIRFEPDQINVFKDDGTV